MNILSKLCLTVFEVANEVLIAVGTGFVGIAVLLSHGYKTHQLLRTLSVGTVSFGCLVYLFQASEEMIKPSFKKVVFISGCDSGLGFSLALYAAEKGFTVVAGFLNLESAGAKEIKRLNKNIRQIGLNITDNESVFIAVETINQYLHSNPTYEFYALINNAGVMVFGEFEWQTLRLVCEQLQTNLFGTLNLTKAFLPLLRKYRGRVMNVISHCSNECLPGLTVYGATKAGIKAFSDGLRVELAKYDVKVVTFTPGSFLSQSNIMANHAEHVREMTKGFTKEQHLYYDDYFQRYNSYLLGMNVGKVPKRIEGDELYKTFEAALLSEAPKSSYKVEPLKYTIYHWFFKFSPVPIRDFLVLRFMNMPQYNILKVL